MHKQKHKHGSSHARKRRKQDITCKYDLENTTAPLMTRCADERKRETEKRNGKETAAGAAKIEFAVAGSSRSLSVRGCLVAIGRDDFADIWKRSSPIRAVRTTAHRKPQEGQADRHLEAVVTYTGSAVVLRHTGSHRPRQAGRHLEAVVVYMGGVVELRHTGGHKPGQAG